MKKRVALGLIIIPILSLAITCSLGAIKYSRSSVIPVYYFYYEKVAGFPFPYHINYTEEALERIDSGKTEPLNTPLMFALSLAFWLMSVSATAYILKDAKRILYLAVSVALATVLLLICVKTSWVVFAGFPAPFYTVLDSREFFIPASYAIRMGTLDYLFWFGISVSLLACHVLVNSLYSGNKLWKRIRVIAYPAVFCILSLVYEYNLPSLGGIGGGTARGFPLPYLELGGRIYWLGLIIGFFLNFAFWLVVYLVCSRIVKKARKTI